jgi:hypothetical protein
MDEELGCFWYANAKTGERTLTKPADFFVEIESDLQVGGRF